MSNSHDPLKLEHQLCFPLYAASREVVRKYTPHLQAIGLTYTQYITMMILWEQDTVSIKELGSRLMLDSGTMTPLLQKLESKGLIKRTRAKDDERCVTISITPKGAKLKEPAKEIPGEIAECINLTPEEGVVLYQLLYKVIRGGRGVMLEETSNKRYNVGKDW